MKKVIISLVTAILTIVSCQRQELLELVELDKFTASVESHISGDTKTSMNSNKQIVWSKEDCIAVFPGSTLAKKYQVTDESVGQTNAEFVLAKSVGESFYAGSELLCNVAFYPYSTTLVLSGTLLEGKGTAYKVEGVEVPQTQVYSGSTFSNNAFLMAAITDTPEDRNLNFKNVLGAVKLQFKGTQIVKSIKFEGNNGERISGPAVVTVYSDGYPPTLSMSELASTEVVLDCADGVQLNELDATEFIIVLPAMYFANGFTVTVTDIEDNVETVVTNVSNKIFRSSILVMPVLSLGDEPGADEPDDAIYAEEVYLDREALTMAPGTSYVFESDMEPVNVTNPALTWISSSPSVAMVDQRGRLTAVSGGTTTITAQAIGGASASCLIKVIELATPKEYVVDGVSYGYGIAIGPTVWAPVNCGYEPTSSAGSGYQHGKLYQWGRQYGQGYNASDMTTMQGPVMPSVAKAPENANVFFTVKEHPYDWCKSKNDNFWNTGTEDSPKKSDTDPCPDGWRVPTYNELRTLGANVSDWTSNEKGYKGVYFSGEYTRIEGAPQLFLAAAGWRSRSGAASGMGSDGYYWSSGTFMDSADGVNICEYGLLSSSQDRARGYSVRCVQDEMSEGDLGGDDVLVVPVSDVNLSATSLVISEGGKAQLTATVRPIDATDQTVVWVSDDSSVAVVDQTGLVTAVACGNTTILAIAGGKVGACSLTVSPRIVSFDDYIDEYGVNHGHGVEIGLTIWAPVNCGYHKDDYKWGKLYQWGRKYGQGYSGNQHDLTQENVWYTTDANTPQFLYARVSESEGNDADNANVFFRGSDDWLLSANDKIWNSGSDPCPEKTKFDPCPYGWRVPTYDELDQLHQNRSCWTTNEAGQPGYWFSGATPYAETVPRIFLPAAGYRSYGDSGAADRGYEGSYWSSRPSDYAYGLNFGDTYASLSAYGRRAYGYTVRCVQE